jgi:hypothetical protein
MVIEVDLNNFIVGKYHRRRYSEGVDGGVNMV